MKHYKDSQNNLFGFDDNVVAPAGYIEITIEEAKEIADSKTPPVTRDHIEKMRAYAFTTEADPLFFKSQRGEATEAEWLAKVEEIRSRYPYA